MVVKILCNFRFLFYLGYSTLFDIEIKLNKMPFPGNYELDFKTAKKNKILESLIIQVSLTYVLHFIYIYRFRCNTL
jgi:hypothetical protein